MASQPPQPWRAPERGRKAQLRQSAAGWRRAISESALCRRARADALRRTFGLSSWLRFGAPIRGSSQGRAYSERRPACKARGLKITLRRATLRRTSAMVAKSLMIDADAVEREINARLKAAKLRL